jgi:hypothetical protein
LTNISLKESAIGIHEQLNAQVGKLYAGLDKLKEICPQLHLTFPQIVVIGDESVGKSSLIERIAMLPFFPRGNKPDQGSLTTRMPIKLQLKHLSAEELVTFAKDHSLEWKEGHFWVRMIYEPVNGQRVISPFFPKDRIEQHVMTYMEDAVKINPKGNIVDS